MCVCVRFVSQVVVLVGGSSGAYIVVGSQINF